LWFRPGTGGTGRCRFFPGRLAVGVRPGGIFVVIFRVEPADSLSPTFLPYLLQGVPERVADIMSGMPVLLDQVTPAIVNALPHMAILAHGVGHIG
jgi:hypothetical protein